MFLNVPPIFQDATKFLYQANIHIFTQIEVTVHNNEYILK